MALNTYPSYPALEFGNEQLTYEELVTRVHFVANRLSVSGVTPDVTVALFLRNTFPSIIGFLALAWIGCAVIPLDPENSSHELEAIQQYISFTYLMSDAPNSAQYINAFPDCSLIDLNILLSAFDSNNRTQIPEPSFVPEKTFLYHLTSGSTGIPKAALHTQSNLINGGAIYQQTYKIDSQDTLLVSIPLCHSFGMVAGLVTSLLSGARLLLSGRLVPTEIVTMLHKKRATIMLATPMIYDIMARCALRTPPDLNSVRLCLSSGSLLRAETRDRFQSRFGLPIHSVYGCTEVGVIAAGRDNSQNQPEQAIGWPMEGVRLRIVDENGDDLAANETGLLLVQTPAMFTGYCGHSDTTEAVLKHGWYITGDFAFLDDHGYLFLVGRKETFINVGGKKVNPVEVENVLLTHPMVKEAVVFGTDAGNLGETVSAAVVLQSPVLIADIIAFCRQRLAFYKIPSQIQIHPELTKTHLGKIRRTEYGSALRKVTPSS